MSYSFNYFIYIPFSGPHLHIFVNTQKLEDHPIYRSGEIARSLTFSFKLTPDIETVIRNYEKEVIYL